MPRGLPKAANFLLRAHEAARRYEPLSRWVEVLRRYDIDSVHWSSIGSGTAADEEIMSYARTEDYVILTNDLDFGAILAATRSAAPSVIQLRAHNLDPDLIASRLVAALKQGAEDLTNGALLTLDADRERLRLLPFT